MTALYGTAGVPVSVQPQAVDSLGGSVSFSATGLPASVTINSSSGLMSGTPSSAGVYSVTINAQSPHGLANRSFTWVIGPVALALPANVEVTGGGFIAIAPIAAYSTDGKQLSYSASGLPAGLSIDKTSGLISGTPTAAGTSTVTVTATSSSGSASATMSLTIDSTVTLTIPGLPS